jgi:1-acyl-sn-glycerol-3-phosphate acyltransferase
MIRYLKAAYFWVMSFSMTAVFFLGCYAAHVWDAFIARTNDGRGVHRLASIWGRTIIRFVPGWRVTVTGREHLVPDRQASVIVANHESMADIWAMYYLGAQFRWLSKDSVFRLPMVGRVMRWARYVSVNRTSRESGVEAMRQSAELLRLGLAMFYFPEGTRSVDGVIKPFKLGAFKLAQGEQVPVQPIAIHGAGNLLKKGSMLTNDTAHVHIKVLPPLPPPGPNADLEEYAARVREQLVAAHGVISREE